MTTRNKVSSARRIHSILWIAAMLLLSVVASGKSMQASRCPDQKSGAGAWATMATATPVASSPAAQADAGLRDRGRPVPADVTTGLDLEVRIWNVRIGFPWLKSLPVTPGRHVVVSLWETESER
jgi:hypothetical protein